MGNMGCIMIETWQGFIDSENTISPYDKWMYIPALIDRFITYYVERHFIAYEKGSLSSVI